MIVEFEQWKPVVGFEGWYEVSNMGKVRRTAPRLHGGMSYVGKILKPKTDKDGYRSVTLCKQGKSHTRRVHSLVARSWIPNPLNKPEVNHKIAVIRGGSDAVSNLEWATRKRNAEHAVANGLYQNGENVHLAKLTWASIAERARYRRPSYRVSNSRELAKEYGVNQTTISLIVRGKTWKTPTTTTITTTEAA